MNYESIVNGIRQKDNGAVVEFYNEFYKDVYYICYKITENEKDAEDIAQETIFRAINKIDLLVNPEGLPAWLRTIANNLSINYLKKNRKFDTISTYSDDNTDILEEQPAVDKTPEDMVADREVADILLSMIDKLPNEQKITIFMFYYQEMSVKEISEAMDCSEATVRSRINYAKKALRKQIEGLEDKGIKLRCICILPFLMAVYSFEKYSVSAHTAMPDILGTSAFGSNTAANNILNNTTAQNGKVNEKIMTTTGKTGLGAGVKAAIVIACALVIGGGAAAALILGGDSNNNSKKNTASNEITTATQPDTIKDIEKLHSSEYSIHYMDFTDSYADENGNLHYTPQGKEETIIEGDFDIALYGAGFNFNAYESNGRFIVIGQNGDKLLDVSSNHHCSISSDEFWIDENGTISRYRITDDAAEPVWSTNVFEVLSIDSFKRVSYNMYQLLIQDENKNYYVLNLQDGNITFSTLGFEGRNFVSIHGEDILVYREDSDDESDFLTTYDSNGNEKFHHTFSSAEHFQVEYSYYRSNTFSIKRTSADGKYIYELLNTDGQILDTSEYIIDDESLSWTNYIGNVSIYNTLGHYTIYADGNIYKSEYVTDLLTRTGYCTFTAEDEKNYCILLETGIVFEIPNFKRIDYDDDSHLGYYHTEDKIVFFNNYGETIYEYNLATDTYLHGIFHNYYNVQNCSYIYFNTDENIVVIIPYEKRVLEFKNVYKEDAIYRLLQNKYLIYTYDENLYTYDFNTNESKALISDNSVKSFHFDGNSLFEIRLNTGEYEIYKIK